jgi:hypothetical protein
MKKKSVVPGMPGLAEPRVVRVRSNASTLTVDFEDGRTVRLPLIWFPRLFRASQAQRDHWELIGPGLGVHWPQLDEDLSAEGLAAGRPSVEFLQSRRFSPAREVRR